MKRQPLLKRKGSLRHEHMLRKGNKRFGRVESSEMMVFTVA
jgi:hypothetical protein